jgi:hypothetical protein
VSFEIRWVSVFRSKGCDVKFRHSFRKVQPVAERLPSLANSLYKPERPTSMVYIVPASYQFLRTCSNVHYNVLISVWTKLTTDKPNACCFWYTLFTNKPNMFVLGWRKETKLQHIASLHSPQISNLVLHHQSVRSAPRLGCVGLSDLCKSSHARYTAYEYFFSFT